MWTLITVNFAHEPAASRFRSVARHVVDLAGNLDLKVGGLPVDIESEPFATRRTIYGLIERQNSTAVFARSILRILTRAIRAVSYYSAAAGAISDEQPVCDRTGAECCATTEIAKAMSAEERFRRFID